MSRVNRTRPAALVALALAAALSLGACNDDENKSDDPPSGGPSSSSGTTEPSDPPTSEPAEPATPLGTGAAPATGQELSFDALSVRIPQGWRVVSKDIEGLI